MLKKKRGRNVKGKKFNVKAKNNLLNIKKHSEIKEILFFNL